jgi:hypothetical protein
MKEHQIPLEPSVEEEVPVLTNVSTTLEQKEEHTRESKQRDRIPEPCVVDLITSARESLLTVEKVQQEMYDFWRYN